MQVGYIHQSNHASTGIKAEPTIACLSYEKKRKPNHVHMTEINMYVQYIHTIDFVEKYTHCMLRPHGIRFWDLEILYHSLITQKPTTK